MIARSIAHFNSDIRGQGPAGSRKEEGSFTAFPRTMIMAMVSPMARPMPKMMLETIPERAAGIITRQMVCQWVAPSARAPTL